MNSTNDGPAPEEKKDRIKALVQELHNQEHRTFLELQFNSQETTYQSYPNNHNLVGLTSPQRESLQDIIEEHSLDISFEHTDGGTTTVTASHTSEPSTTDHMEILEDVIHNVYDTRFENIDNAFLESRGPDTPEPLLWTDIRNN